MQTIPRDDIDVVETFRTHCEKAVTRTIGEGEIDERLQTAQDVVMNLLRHADRMLSVGEATNMRVAHNVVFHALDFCADTIERAGLAGAEVLVGEVRELAEGFNPQVVLK